MGQEEREPFVVIPFLPPSSNHCYVTDWRRKMRFPTKEAAAFKKKVIALVAQECQHKITPEKLDREGTYFIWYAFYFPKEELLNMTFGSGKKGAAATRYKRMDVENRLKLVTDAFATAIGIDDCQFFEGGHTKMCADLLGGQPQIRVFFTQADPRRFGL